MKKIKMTVFFQCYFYFSGIKESENLKETER